MKKLLLLTAALLFFGVAAYAQKPRIVTAAQANGVYKYRNNEIRILALGGGKLKVRMDLVYAYQSAAGPTANIGFALGEADIENDLATFRPPNTEGCVITLKFLPGNKLRVEEEGMLNCGFGFNVSSAGVYRKIKSGKPKFDENR
jgi:hypothetical protein